MAARPGGPAGLVDQETELLKRVVRTRTNDGPLQDLAQDPHGTGCPQGIERLPPSPGPGQGSSGSHRRPDRTELGHAAEEALGRRAP